MSDSSLGVTQLSGGWERRPDNIDGFIAVLPGKDTESSLHCKNEVKRTRYLHLPKVAAKLSLHLGPACDCCGHHAG